MIYRQPSDAVLNTLTTAFNEYVEDVLDNPEPIAHDAPNHIRKMRLAAEWLGIDFDQLLNTHPYGGEVERLLKLESGEPDIQ